jgi:hypothetical protein
MKKVRTSRCPAESRYAPVNATVAIAQLQDHLAAHDEVSDSQFGLDRPASSTEVDAGPQVFEILLFRIVRSDILEGFQALLDMVGQLHLRLGVPAVVTVLELRGEQDDGDRDGYHPHGGQRHAPVKEEEADADEGGGQHGADEFRHPVRRARLDDGGVGHDGAGQVREVLLAEEGSGRRRSFSARAIRRRPLSR